MMYPGAIHNLNFYYQKQLYIKGDSTDLYSICNMEIIFNNEADAAAFIMKQSSNIK